MARRGIDPEKALFVLLIAAHLVPIWAFAHFPSQDGPTHLENAQILREYDHPDRTAFRDYYTINTHPSPNWFGHLVLAALLCVFPPVAAEKILVSGYLILFPLAVRYALRAIRPESAPLAILAFPFTYNFLFNMGFYNFVYSLPIFFLVVGRWIKDRGRLTPKGTASLAGLCVLLYFCHLISLVLALIAVAVLASAFACLDLLPLIRRRPLPRSSILAVARDRLLPGIAAFLPSLLLAGLFLLRKGTETPPVRSSVSLLRRLLSLDSLGSHHPRETLLGISVAALFGAALLYLLISKIARRLWVPLDALLLVAAIVVTIFFTTPERMSGGEFITHRINLFPCLVLILWFGAQSWNRVAGGAVRGLAALLSLGMLVSQGLSYGVLNAQLDEYLSGMNLIERNSTLLPLCFSPFGRLPDGRRASGRVGAFLHASGYIAAERRVVDLDNYEANTDYFPIIFRPERNPESQIAIRKGGLETQPPCVDFLSYPDRTGAHVDYVLLWDPREELSGEGCVALITQELRERYDLIHTSPGRGMMRLYRRKDLTSPSPSIPH